jgi:alanine racemase
MSTEQNAISKGFRTWIEVDTKAIAHNYNIFRSLIKAPTKLMSVVKSNAYGHGLVDFSKQISALGVDWLGVDSVVEGLRLRKERIDKPILTLGYTLPERIPDAIRNNISLTISNMFALRGLKNLNLKEKVNIHIKVDSGMHRQGFMEDEQKIVIDFLLNHKNSIEVEGLYTHFAAAKDPAHPEFTKEQMKIFKTWIEAFKKAGMKPIIHAAATGAALLFPETHFDIVRIGIGFHGLWPSAETEAYLQKNIELKPTLTWKTIISETKDLPVGAKIGYDFTHTIDRKTKIAVCPIGYWHGYSRSLSNRGLVLVHGIRAKVLGRVSMDMIIIDVTDISKVAIGDEVVLIGRSGDDCIGAHEIGLLADESDYEFITRLNPLIKKIYI